MMTTSEPTDSASRVALTPPSTEFSIGTIAASRRPARRASSAATTESHGTASPSADPGQAASAIWQKVPVGPRKP